MTDWLYNVDDFHVAWQIAAPDTLKAAQAAHAETAAAMTREQIQ